MKKIILSLIVLSFFQVSVAQKKGKNNTPDPTSASVRWEGYQKRQELTKNSLVANIPFKNVGPTVMSGRIVDLEVDPDDPTHFYAAFASGGLWETTNEGASFRPLFQNQIVMTIGDIAVDWENEIIYVGSGENNSSRSSYSGYGMFKSVDNGSTWTHVGLPESHHIGRILIDPTNKKHLIVGVLGRLYSQNEERGVYESTDGGETWNKTLYVDDQTGIVDLAMNPNDPAEIVAAAWQKDRKAWNFVESGKGSALYRSTDGGTTWQNISEGNNGFPDTEGMGRVGIAFGPDGDIYAVLDNQQRRPKEDKEDGQELTKDDFRDMSEDEFMSLDNSAINDFLDENNFPASYNAVDIKEDIARNKIEPRDLVIYLEDANSMLFDTPVKGGEVYKSTNGGDLWTKTHEGYIESFVFSYGYYFGQIRVDQKNPDNIYILGVPILTSDDGGKTWKNIQKQNVHSDHHALWINPERSGHLILGNDGGVNYSYDNGENWVHCNSLPVGQFYAINVDMATPYNVYGGLQDNGVWFGPSDYQFSRGWYSSGDYPYERIMGGDGMQVAIDNRDNTTVYTGYQFGNYYRLNTKSGERKYITPQHKLGDVPYRWNWQAPIMLSTHNQDIVYFGSNRFHRSMDKGDNFETLSGDLTKGGIKGDVSFGTLTTISESSLRFGLIYTGSDDGIVSVSRDAGQTWKDISKGLPENFWISRVEASNHQEGRVFVSLNGYRWDHFEALVYMSEDYGDNWHRISSGLPAEPVNVIREDPKNEDVLYVGTDHGTYVSLNRGKDFMAFDGGMPAVAVHDLVVHPRENELVVGTHGRSIYIGDISLVQKLSPEVQSKEIHIFDLATSQYSSRWGTKGWEWSEYYQPTLQIPFYSSSGREVSITILQNDLKLMSWDLDVDKGVNFAEYNLVIDNEMAEKYADLLSDDIKEEFEVAEDGNYYLRPGTYTVQIQGVSASFEISLPRQRPARKE